MIWGSVLHTVVGGHIGVVGYLKMSTECGVVGLQVWCVMQHRRVVSQGRVGKKGHHAEVKEGGCEVLHLWTWHFAKKPPQLRAA